MHLMVVMVFGLAMWRTGNPPFGPLLTTPLQSIAAAGIFPLVWWLIGRRASARAMQRLAGAPAGVDAAQFIYHRNSIALRFLALLGFAACFFLTRWPELVAGLRWLPAWSGLQELVIVLPFFAAVLAGWLGLFPADRALREFALRARQWEHVPSGRVWSLGEYLLFNARHQILTAAVPMMIILAAWAASLHFRRALVETFKFPWAADAIPAIVAGAVFLLSPALLKRIWSTTTLADGPLRRRLELACGRAGLRCRDILVWKSHGMMINAAVMGLIPRVRYVLLSDALLDGLDNDGIEAVFGHEAGHIRHRHIQYFLLFALITVLIVSGIMETCLRWALRPDGRLAVSELTIQGIGLAAVVLLWGTAFGWISRRFERQADVFGAQCASPAEGLCSEPCGVHAALAVSPPPSEPGRPRPGPGCGQPGSERGGAPALTTHDSPLTPEAVCASGARIFVAALDRVAVLNGIPHEEPSWRHSSIGSRMRFLTALAGDPALARAFQQRIVAIKRTLWACAIAGLTIGAAYMWWQPDYRAMILQSTIVPFQPNPAPAPSNAPRGAAGPSSRPAPAASRRPRREAPRRNGLGATPRRQTTTAPREQPVSPPP